MSQPRGDRSSGTSRPSATSRGSSFGSSGGGARRAGQEHGPIVDPDDFCNAFWGDAGYHALISRVKASTRMLEDLKTWYKERAAVEEEYAKKLTRLSKAPVLAAGYEVGGFKGALQSVKDATASSAHSHSELAGTIRSALGGKLSEFISRRDGVRKNPQALIEKLFKKRIDLADIAEKSRKKYEADAIAVNGYQAQTHLAQNRELDKVLNKLDKARDTLVINEKEYRTHMKNVQDTAVEWVGHWKTFCDLAQDLEEDRIDFVRTSLWDYANGISTICMVDDEQCEMMRTSWEKCHTVRDIRRYVKHAGTGNEIHEAPQFVNYAKGEQPRNRPAVSSAKFLRSSTRNPRALAETTAIDELMEAIRAGPPAPEPAPDPGPTLRETKEVTRRGGAIADMVAAMAFRNRGGGEADKSEVSPSPYEGSQVSPSDTMRRSPSPARSNHSIARSDGAPRSRPASVAGSYVSMNRPLPAEPGTSSGLLPPLPGPVPSGSSGGGFGRMASPGHTPASYTPAQSPAPPVTSHQYSQSLPPPVPDNSEKPKSRVPSRRPPDMHHRINPVMPPALVDRNGLPDPMVAALEKLRNTRSMGGFSLAPSATPSHQITHHLTTHSQVHSASTPTMQSPRSPQAPASRGPGNYSCTGQPILFYVRATHDYAATCQEEFSFQAGDLIAIVQAPADGWWRGEHVDQRLRGRGEGNTLPRTFVEVVQ